MLGALKLIQMDTAFIAKVDFILRIIYVSLAIAVAKHVLIMIIVYYVLLATIGKLLTMDYAQDALMDVQLVLMIKFALLV